MGVWDTFRLFIVVVPKNLWRGVKLIIFPYILKKLIILFRILFAIFCFYLIISIGYQIAIFLKLWTPPDKQPPIDGELFTKNKLTPWTSYSIFIKKQWMAWQKEGAQNGTYIPKKINMYWAGKRIGLLKWRKQVKEINKWLRKNSKY